MTASEFKFFGGIRAFEHNVLRRIKAKEVAAQTLSEVKNAMQINYFND